MGPGLRFAHMIIIIIFIIGRAPALPTAFRGIRASKRAFERWISAAAESATDAVDISVGGSAAVVAKRGQLRC